MYVNSGVSKEYDCSKFENENYVIKHLVKSGKSPLQKACNRIADLFAVGYYNREQTESQRDTPLLIKLDERKCTQEYDAYKRLILNGVKFRGDRVLDDRTRVDKT